MIKAILGGIFSGIITAVMGYFKSKEEFKLKKFVQTIIIGAIVGAYMGYSGINYEQAYEYLTSIGIITLIEYVTKSVWKRVKA